MLFFYHFFFRRCTIISDLDFDFKRVQQLFHFHPKTQALCKSSETIDDMKLGSSSDTDSSCENTYNSSEGISDNVTFCRWQIVGKKITKSKVDVMFKDAAEIFKDDIKTLKEHIYVKRKQANAYHEIEASLSENDLMLHVDFAENYTIDQQDAIKSEYFGNQCFRIFTACYYAKSPNNNDFRNDNVIDITGSSVHDMVATISSLQKVVHQMKRMHEKTYKNFYVWVDGMGSQLRSRYILKLLASKSTMTFILRKDKSGQLVVHSPLKISETMTKFVPSI